MTKLDCILLIDDSEVDNFYHKMIINDCNVVDKVRIAENGLEGLDYLNNKGRFENADENPTPQIIFLDINMPKMNGFEFLEEYKNLPEELRANHCIMMLTTSINPKDKLKAESYGILSGYSTKPLEKEVLIKLIEDHFS
ncbi:MAG: response regulator [Crocinitomicaceae bacterium]|nr:response regulator [Crocinitomicaceae bacterium]